MTKNEKGNRLSEINGEQNNESERKERERERARCLCAQELVDKTFRRTEEL